MFVVNILSIFKHLKLYLLYYFNGTWLILVYTGSMIDMVLKRLILDNTSIYTEMINAIKQHLGTLLCTLFISYVYYLLLLFTTSFLTAFASSNWLTLSCIVVLYQKLKHLKCELLW